MDLSAELEKVVRAGEQFGEHIPRKLGAHPKQISIL